MRPNLGYILQSETPEGLLKVGRSAHPDGRFRQIGAGGPFKVRQIAIFADGPKLEADIKDLARGQIVRGEWYAPSEEIVRYVQCAALRGDVVERFGITEEYAHALIIPRMIQYLAGRPCGHQPLGDFAYRILNGQPLAWVGREDELRKAFPNVFTLNELAGYRATSTFSPIVIPHVNSRRAAS